MITLKDIAQEYDLPLTQDFTEAIWLDLHINLLDGEYCDGIRSNDYRIILDNNTTDFDSFHDRGYIRLVSESHTALIKEGQPINTYQMMLIQRFGYTLQTY